MDMLYDKKFQLSDAQCIDEIAELVWGCLIDMGVEKKQAIRIKLSAEEILLRWRECEENGFCRATVKKSSYKLSIEFSLNGRYWDPFVVKDEPDGGLNHNLLAVLGSAFRFNYHNGKNTVFLTVRKRGRNTFIPLLAAIVSAVVLGYMLPRLSPNFSKALLDSVCSPIFNTFIGFLSAIVAPTMFLMVVWGILSIGDIGKLGKIGSVIASRFMGISLISAMIAVTVAFTFFNFKRDGTASDGNQITALFEMLLNIVPNNILSPFLNGNVLQIIFLAGLVGIVMLTLRNRVSYITELVEEANAITQKILEWIATILPLFIFINVLRLFLSGDIFKMGSVLKMVGLYFLCNFMLLVIYFASIALKEKVSPIWTLKKMLPTFLINLMTASSASSFSTNTECCEKELGIHKKLVEIGVPLGVVMHKSSTIVYFILLSVFSADVNGVGMSTAGLFTTAIISVILSVAVPPVVGGNLSCYTLLFLQLGIPLDTVALAVALDAVLDFFITSFDILGLQVQLLHVSKKLGMLNAEKLRS